MKNLIELADGEYALAKEEARRAGRPHSVTLTLISRRFGLTKRALHHYRANNYSRKKTRRTT